MKVGDVCRCDYCTIQGIQGKGFCVVRVLRTADLDAELEVYIFVDTEFPDNGDRCDVLAEYLTVLEAREYIKYLL